MPLSLKIKPSKFLSLTWLGIYLIVASTACRVIKERPQSTILFPEQQEMADFTAFDSVTIFATKVYRGGLIKQIFQGHNYRKAWQMPITIPVVFLDTLDGGLTPVRRGGGNQTLSMDLENPDGIIYTLRSVNKDPTGIVPKIAYTIHLSNIITDAMSAQHPYGALPAGALADAMDVLNSSPRLVFIPHQTALDSFDADYGGHIFFLEYEPDGRGKWVDRPNVKEIVSTKGVQKLLVEHPDSYVDEAALLRARFLDIVMGDWDRHAKQWGWVVLEKDSTYVYEPMANDRDNVFYNAGGVFPWIITRPLLTPFIRPHRKGIDYFSGYVKPFDLYFLYDTPLEAFEGAAAKLQEDLTDEAIEQAFSTWPKTFYDEDAPKIMRRIKARRDKLSKYARKFYRVVQKKGPLEKPLKGSDELYERDNKIAR